MRVHARWALVGVGVILGLLLPACGGDPAGPPPAPSASLGVLLDKPVSAQVANLPLTDDQGRTISMAALHGQIVVLADFMTLCQETCPLTTGNLLDMDQAVTAAGLSPRVRFVELTVDPGRDTPARLAAYRKLVGAPANWLFLTGSSDTINSIWRYFGVWYQKQPEGSPPGLDWLTGRPLSYDITHEDAVIYLDPAGRERFIVVGAPNASGSPIAPALRQFLSSQGRADLAHPDASTWTAQEGLSPIAWLARQPIHAAATRSGSADR
jgi:protein SCO1/2